MDEDEFYRNAREKLYPKMKASAIAVIIATEPDPKLCMEIGAAVLFDKPLVVVVPLGEKLPSNLSRIASAIVQGDANPAKTKQRMEDAITRVLANDKRVKQ